MKDKAIAALLAAVMVVGMITGCSASGADSDTGSVGVPTEAAEDNVQDVESRSIDSSTEGTTGESAVADNGNLGETDEGYTVVENGYTSVVAWAKNGEKNIYGEFYYPEEFDKSRQYPVVIMSHGGSVTHEFYEKAGWPSVITKLGYVCYAYDFCGGSTQSLSDLETTDATVLTEKSDLYAVMDFVKDQFFCNQEELYLMGQSFGGFITGLTAGERADEVAGMILLYPAFSVVDVLHETFPSLEDVPEEETIEFFNTEVGRQYVLDMYDIDVMESLSAYEGDVLIIHGMADPTIPYTYSVDAITNAYAEADSELVLITGAKSLHAFELVDKTGKQYACAAVEEFLAGHVEAIEE